MSQENEKANKLKDINAIDFGEDIQEITTSMEIVLMLFQVDDDEEVIAACKCKLSEGIALLKKLDQDETSKKFEEEL